MTLPTKLDDTELSAWLASRPDWTRDGVVLSRTYSLGSYSRHVALAVQIAMAAEKRDHHPDMVLKWGSLTVEWTTHDAGGLSALDLSLAEACDLLARDA